MADIRRYVSSDYPAVQRILEQSDLFWDASDDQDSLDKKVKGDPDSILVAVEQGAVIGTVFITDDFQPMIYRLGVDQRYRRNGVATELLRHAEQILRHRGRKHMGLLVNVEDTSVQDFYGRHGFEPGTTYFMMTLEFKGND